MNIVRVVKIKVKLKRENIIDSSYLEHCQETLEIDINFEEAREATKEILDLEISFLVIELVEKIIIEEKEVEPMN